MKSPAIVLAQVNPDGISHLITVLGIILAGILVVGLAMILFTIHAGRRARHAARRELPKQTPVDELWHLKGKGDDLPTGVRTEGEPE